MSMKAKPQPVVQLKPRVNVCNTNPHTVLVEVERLILAGYRLDLKSYFTMVPGCYSVSLALPEG